MVRFHDARFNDHTRLKLAAHGEFNLAVDFGCIGFRPANRDVVFFVDFIDEHIDQLADLSLTLGRGFRTALERGLKTTGWLRRSASGIGGGSGNPARLVTPLWRL